MSYNGWKNRETWNVALWIGGDEGLYNLAKESSDYACFVDQLQELNQPHAPIAFQTPDGVAWNDSGVDIEEVDNFIKEL